MKGSIVAGGLMGIALGAMVTFVLAHGPPIAAPVDLGPTVIEAPRAQVPTESTESTESTGGEQTAETAPYRPLRPGGDRYGRPAQS